MDTCNAEGFLKHPLADELDDYRDYKSIISDKRARAKRATPRRVKGPKVAPHTPPITRRQGVAMLARGIATPEAATPSTNSGQSVIISHEVTSKDISHPGRIYLTDAVDGIAEEGFDSVHDWHQDNDHSEHLESNDEGIGYFLTQERFAVGIC
jgi:hypothetical protein